MSIFKWLNNSFYNKFFSYVFCSLMLFSGMPISVNAAPYVNETNKDTIVDFNTFLEQCSMQERVQMLQSLKGLDIDLKDEYFGVLTNLPDKEYFTEDKDKVSATLPLKPETFNQVSPNTVIDAIQRGYIKAEVISRENICKELVWRRYNKCNYIWHNHNKINYHEDIVQWVARKKDIPQDQINSLHTYALERKISEKYFAEIWDKLTEQQRAELLTKIETQSNCSFDNKTAIATYSGAAAIGVLSTTIAFSGFAFYTTMSVVISTVAGWLGVTLPFAVYTTTSAGIAALGGPVGWVIAGGLLAGGTIALGWPEADTIACLVMVVNTIKSKHLKNN